MKNKAIFKSLAGVSLSLFVAFLFVAAPLAHADDPTDGVPSDTSCCDFGSGIYTPTPDYGSGIYTPTPTTNYYPDTYTNYYPDTTTNYYPDTTTNYYPDTNTNYYPDTASYGSSATYGSASYGGSSSYGGFSFGASLPIYSVPQFAHFSNPIITPPSNTVVTTNTNTCTAPNTCNTSYDNHSIFNAPTTVTVSNPAPQNTVVYSNPQPPVYYPPVQPPVYYPPAPAPRCAAGYVGTPPYCVIAPSTPYITLSSVPYTGLDLGPWGTVIYWSLLILWCLFAAYLLVVKRVQNTIARYFKVFLFGGEYKVAAANIASQKSSDLPVRDQITAQQHSPSRSASASPSYMDFTDSFVLSQINRGARA